MRLPQQADLDAEVPAARVCACLTTDANELASEVHNRMPVILDADDYDSWLVGEEIPRVPFDSERMTVRAISTTINNVKNQGSQCVEPR